MDKLRVPTPALVISLIALFIALGGTGYAASQSGDHAVAAKAKAKRLNSTQKKQVVSLIKKETKGLGATGPSGTNGPTGTTGATGPQGPQGSQGNAGAQGTPGEAVAYASVDSTGALNTNARPAKNVVQSNVEHPAVGVYCFHDLTFTARSAVVSADNAFSQNFTIASVITVTDGALLAPCSAAAVTRVRTVEVPSGATYTPSALADRDFVIWFES